MQDFVIFPAVALLIIWMIARRFTSVIRYMAKSPELRTLFLSAVTLLAGGTYVFHRVEQWDVLDSLYYCVITLTTVGYGDMTPHTSVGKTMAIVYILMGLGVIMAFVTTVAQVSIAQAKEFQDALLEARRRGSDPGE